VSEPTGTCDGVGVKSSKEIKNSSGWFASEGQRIGIQITDAGYLACIYWSSYSLYIFQVLLHMYVYFKYAVLATFTYILQSCSRVLLCVWSGCPLWSWDGRPREAAANWLDTHALRPVNSVRYSHVPVINNMELLCKNKECREGCREGVVSDIWCDLNLFSKSQLNFFFFNQFQFCFINQFAKIVCQWGWQSTTTLFKDLGVLLRKMQDNLM